MRIRCLECGHSEVVSVDLFVKILGGATAGFGFWAWVSFLFAGTGFALPICIAIAAGGTGMLILKDPIVKWIVNKGYECEKCGGKKWSAVSSEMEKEIDEKEAKISILENESKELKKDLTDKEKEVVEYIKKQDSSFSLKDVDVLFGEIDEKNSEIEVLLKDNENLKESYLSARKKVAGNLEKQFSALYSSLSFSKRALKRIERLEGGERLKLEQQLGFLQHNPQNANFRDDIMGTDVKELGFGTSGRIYVRKEGSRYIVVCVGNKNSQNADLKHLKNTYAS